MELNQLNKNSIEQNFLNSNFFEVEKEVNKILNYGNKDPWIYNILAVTYAKQNKFELAEKYFLGLIELVPDDFDAYFNTANFYRNIGKFDKSINMYAICHNKKPNDLKTLLFLSVLSTKLERDEQALIYINLIINIDPLNKDNLLQRAICLLKLGNFRDALDCFHKIGKIYGYNNEINSDIGVCHFHLGEYKKAYKYYKISVEMDSVKYNIAILNLIEGNYKEGWNGFDFGISQGGRILREGHEKFDNLPFWDPNIHSESVVLIGEQGIGDEIMYSTILGDLLESVKEVFLFCDPRIKNLIIRKFKNIKFIDNKSVIDVNRFQSRLPIGSLPKFFRNSEEDFNTSRLVNYKPEVEKLEKLDQKLKKYNKPIIGISWHSKNKQFGPSRNIQLSSFIPLFKNDNFYFMNLQYGDFFNEINIIESKLKKQLFIKDDIDNTNDIEGFAAKITKCDIVITIDNSTVHLAGVLNTKTFLLLPKLCDWRWQKNRLDAPWYGNVRILRQRSPDNWDDQIDEIRRMIT